MIEVKKIDHKNPAAVLGQKGGNERAANLSAEELSAIGRAGAKARWGKKAKKAATKKGA